MVDDKNPRLGITVSPDLYAAITAESDQTGATISVIARKAIEQYLRERGHKIKGSVKWGGYRDRDDAGG